MFGFKFKTLPTPLNVTKNFTKLKSNKVFYSTQEVLWFWKTCAHSVRKTQDLDIYKWIFNICL